MYTAQFSDEIKNIIEQYDHQSYDYDVDELIADIQKIETYAQDNDATSLMGYVNYQRAKLALLHDQNFPAYREHLMQAIKQLQDPDDADMLASCYNLAGIESMEHCNYELAITLFLTAARILEPLRDYQVSAMINANIGSLYADIGDYTQALTYLTECIRLMEMRKPEGGEVALHLVGVCLNGWFALEVGDKAAARTAYDKLWQVKMDITVPPESLLNVTVLAFEARYAYDAGEFEEADRLIAEALSSMKDVNRATAAAEDLCRFADFLLRIEKYQETKVILDFLEQDHAPEIAPSEQIAVAALYLQYAEKMQDEALIKERQKIYYRLNRDLLITKNDIYTFSLELAALRDDTGKSRLLELEEDVRRNRQRDIDPTTLLPSRRQFNQHLLEAYRKAVRDDTALGIATIEIDGYEDIVNANTRDTIGIVLRHVADVLRSATNDKCSCYRYGGGRFLMIYRTMSNHEIYAKATFIRESISEAGITPAGGGTPIHITVSQGISNRIPNERVFIWDFVSEANKALSALRRQKTSNEIAFNARKH